MRRYWCISCVGECEIIHSIKYMVSWEIGRYLMRFFVENGCDSGC